VTIYSDLPYVHALGDGGVRPATTCVVIHATDNTASASAEASYARTRPDKTSAHFYVDDRQVIQALDTSHIAYGCLYHGNRISIQFELCGLSNHVSDAVMRKAAATVARVCRDNGIPVRKVGASDVRNGVKGICGHGDITAAFPEDNGDHTDPGGAFPWATFISYVTGGTTMGTANWTERQADLAGALANAIIGGKTVVDLPGSNDNWEVDDATRKPKFIFSGWTVPLLKHIEEIHTAVTGTASQSTVTLSDADRAAITQALAALVPTADQIADRIAARLGNG
jgi:hypothetical protein